MNLLNIAPYVCAFIVALCVLPSLKNGVKPIHWIVGVVSLFIMGFSIYQSSVDSDEMGDLKTKLEKAASDRIVDSANSAYFQKYLKDTFGIEKVGNEAKIVNRNTYIRNITYNSFVPNLNNLSVDDSENKDYKLSKNRDTLILFPKNGVWVKPFFSFDASLENKNQIMLQSDGMYLTDSRLPPEETIIGNTRYKTLTVHLSVVRSKQFPLVLDISADKNQYIIFGDEADPQKRYLYKNGKVLWAPNL